MFLFLHAISHFHLSTLSHLSPLATTNHLAAYRKHFNIYPSFLCAIIACIKKKPAASSNCSGVRSRFVNSPLETNDGTSVTWGIRGGSCGMRISLEDQCTINNFTDNSPRPLSHTAKINTPN